jgi:cobalt-zinc-cadmium resistance protein CzcA
VGSLALFGVAVRTGIIMLEYSNQLRARGEAVLSAAVNGSVQRLLPIRMTMMVATLGLLPALYMWLARDGDVLPEVEREAI